MIVPSQIATRFENIRPYLPEIERRVDDVLLRFCKEKGYAYSSRTKELESLSEKIESGRISKWSEIDDLFACTVVVPTLAHERPVLDFLSDSFDRHGIRARGQAKKAPDVFRFDSTRFIGRLKKPLGLELANEIWETPFEIQIRSAFEHAWIAATHDVTYKSNTIDWKRLRLAAQLKASVEQLDSLILTFDQSSNAITESKWPEIMTKSVVISFMIGLVKEKTLPSEFVPRSWSRLGENIFQLLKAAKRTEQASEALKTIREEIRSLGPDQVPRSISLFQLVVGVLSQKEFLKPPLPDFALPITPELAEFFPSVKAFDRAFQFQL